MVGDLSRAIRMAAIKRYADSEITIRAATCCVAFACIVEMRLNDDYDRTIHRAGNNNFVRFDYKFQCLHCDNRFAAYVVCRRDAWPPLAEFVDTNASVPAAEMSNTFAQLTL